MTRLGLLALLALTAGASVAARAAYQPPISQAAVAAQISAAIGAMSIPTQYTNAMAAAAAPVQMVNSKTGSVTVPTLCRQQSTALAIPTSNPALVSWTFPNATCSFSQPPSCWMDVSTTSTLYAFDYPLNTARSATAVTYSFVAHANTLSIALGSLSLTVGPPSGSTVVMTCTAPPA